MRLSKNIFYNLEKFYLVLNRISDKEIRVICKEIGILLESGCEITKIFEIIESQSSKKVKNLLSIVSNHITLLVKTTWKLGITNTNINNIDKIDNIISIIGYIEIVIIFIL